MLCSLNNHVNSIEIMKLSVRHRKRKNETQIRVYFVKFIYYYKIS